MAENPRPTALAVHPQSMLCCDDVARIEGTGVSSETAMAAAAGAGYGHSH